jgi:hypothetical protein
MNPQDPTTSVVKRRTLDGKNVPDALSAMTNTCSAGAQCPEVQASPVATAALADLQSNVATASAALTSKLQLDQDSKTAKKKLFKAFSKVKSSLATYETSVNGISAGDGSVINKAGLEARADNKPPATPVEKVSKVTTAPGKASSQARIQWPATPGADHFEVQVNLTPQNTAATWSSLGTCTRRTKVVTAASAGAQLLVRVAAIASDGTRADWSDAILATAR